MLTKNRKFSKILRKSQNDYFPDLFGNINGTRRTQIFFYITYGGSNPKLPHQRQLNLIDSKAFYLQSRQMHPYNVDSE